jgi:hypothetical protein
MNLRRYSSGDYQTLMLYDRMCGISAFDLRLTTPSSYLGDELRWSQTKVDDLLLPIIRKMGQRSRVCVCLLVIIIYSKRLQIKEYHCEQAKHTLWIF